jgi:energy-coupling factor transporter transmembrane protein EcfT
MLIGLNIIGFLPVFSGILYIILLLEVVLAVLVRIDFFRIAGFFKILIWNFLGMFLLFYFVQYDWSEAARLLIHYAMVLLIMFFGVFLFIHTTPPRQLLFSLRSVKIPKQFAVGFTIAISFLPVIVTTLRNTKMTQESRGYRLSLWNLGPILIPSILTIMDFSMDLSLSLEARGMDF